jgi:hypothetical protein
MDKTNLLLGTMSFSPWAMLAIWLYLGALQEIQGTLKHVLNIELFPTCIELNMGTLGVVGKLVKDVAQLLWRHFEEN